MKNYKETHPPAFTVDITWFTGVWYEGLANKAFNVSVVDTLPGGAELSASLFEPLFLSK